METYFPMQNNQRDASTMLYSRDRLADSNSETQVLQGNTIMYMNNYASSSGPNYSNSLNSHPIAASDHSNTSQQEIMLNFGGSQSVQNPLTTWNDSRGLSLSLGSHLPIQYQNDENNNPDFSPIMGHNSALLHNEDRGKNMCFENEDDYQNKQTRDSDYVLSSDVSTYGGVQSTIVRGVSNSKYLKAAQQLLDEVVNVKKGVKEQQNAKKELTKNSKELVEEELCEGTPATPKVNRSELSVAEKQDLQNKMSKLLSMLDEVDRRYRQYYHQMQIVVSSFDVIAGSGAAKPYTAVALQTISRHFRCLRDSINTQIHLARKSLGEEDSSSNDSKGVGISRLRYVDHQLKQHRALQQLGIMQQHAWRPQRGLPETSVSILRAWLFEHFLHPYPKDSDKIMLARQTGLTRSQVSNWFINARVRLWKPMVEEMYKEETGEADIDSNSSSETISRTVAKPSNNKGEEFLQQGTTISTDQMTDIEMMGSDNNSIFQTSEQHIDYGTGKTRGKQITESTRFQDSVAESSCGGDRFITSAYHISDMERFGSVSEVSLTLGLQQCEGGFIPMRETDDYNNASNSAMVYENEEFDRRNQFISSLLPSFT